MKTFEKSMADRPGVYSPDLSLLAYGRYLERKGKENLPRTLAIVKNCQKFLLKTAILFVKRKKLYVGKLCEIFLENEK